MLIGNGVRAGGGPYRYRGGAGALAIERALALNPGSARSSRVGQGLNGTALSGRPSGVRHPQAWLMPCSPGGAKSYRRTGLTISALGDGALGRNGAGTVTLEIQVAGLGAMVASGTGTVTITLDGTAAWSVSLGGTGRTDITLDGTAALGALAWAAGAVGIELGGAANIMALGWMSGNAANTGELTPEAVAAAVGARVLEAGFTYDQVLRLLAAHAAGNGADLNGSAPEFTGLDGTTVRLAATLAGGTRTITTRNAS